MDNMNQNNQNDFYSQQNYGGQYGAVNWAEGCMTNIIKNFLFILEAMAVLFVILFLCGNKFAQCFVEDIVMYATEGEPYISMVQECELADTGITYSQIVNKCFERSQWIYFKTDDGRRIVELNGYTGDDNICIQFLLSPENERDIFKSSILIEPNYISVNDVPVSDILSWFGLIMAGLFG